MRKFSHLAIGISLTVALAACGGSEKKTEENKETKEAKATEEKAATPQQYTVIPGESKVVWSGKVLGVYEHQGTVDVVEGALETKGTEITGGHFVVDLNTMVATDENFNPEEGKTKEKLIGHLSSPDFFDVEAHPNATFEIISSDPANKTLVGNLTIRGITNEEIVTDVMIADDAASASGELTFDRKKYDVAFVHPAEDVVISDDVHLDIQLKL